MKKGMKEATSGSRESKTQKQGNWIMKAAAIGLGLAIGLGGITTGQINVYGKNLTTTQQDEKSAAREKLAQMNIAFNEATFVEKINSGDLETVKLFLAAGMSASLEHKLNDYVKAPVLFDAAGKGNVAMVKLLVEKGADINARASFGYTPFNIAVANSRKEVVEFLIDKVDKNVCSDALFNTTYNGDIEIARLLLDKGANINVKDNDGDTPLTSVAANGNFELAKVLIDRGADLNAQGNYTPLAAAILNGKIELVKLMIDKGANVNINGKMSGPINVAASKGNVDIAKLLVNKSADINAKDSNGNSALINASYQGHMAMVKFLLDKGADINIKGKYGTAIENAALQNNKDIVQLLESKGAKVNTAELRLVNASYCADNEASAIETMRLFHSCEATYQSGIGQGKFGTATDLFNQDFIDASVADASGVAKMTSIGKQESPGTGVPRRGYTFTITLTPTGFTAIGMAARPTGDNKSGSHNYFVDESGIIRMSDDASTVPNSNSKPINN